MPICRRQRLIHGYRSRLTRELSKIPVPHLPVSDTSGPPLKDIYSSFQLIGPDDFHAGSAQAVARGEIYRERLQPGPGHRFSLNELLAENKRLLILKTPGSGASTMLAYAAQKAASNPLSPLPVSASTLSYIKAKAAQPSISLRKHLLLHAADGDRDLYNALERISLTERILWLVDDIHLLTSHRDDFHFQLNELPGRLVATADIFSYRSNELQESTHARILPLGKKAWKELFEEYLAFFQTMDDSLYGMVARTASRNALVSRLVENPLDLSFLAASTTLKKEFSLPASRASLIESVIEGKLGNFHKALMKFPRDPLFEVLSASAWFMFEQSSGIDAGMSGVDYSLLTQSLEAGLPGSAEILETCCRCRVLQKSDNASAPTVFFSNRVFYDFFLARRLAKFWSDNPVAAWGTIFRPNVHNPGWARIISLTTELMDASEAGRLIRHVLDEHNPFESSLKRAARSAAFLIAQHPDPDSSLTRETACRLSSVIRTNHYIKSFLLFLFFLSGISITAFLPYTPLFLKYLSAVFWTMLWVGSFLICLMPSIRVCLALPSRPFSPVADPLPFVRAAAALPGGLPSSLEAALTQREYVGVQIEAARALGYLRHPSSIAPLRKLLNDKKSDINARIEAMSSLVDIAAATAADSLIKLVRDPYDDIKLKNAAAMALGAIGASIPPETLSKELNHRSPTVRELTATALGISLDHFAVPALAQASRDTYPEIRVAAMTALGRIGKSLVSNMPIPEKEAGPPLESKNFSGVKTDEYASMALEALVDGLRDHNEAVRDAAVSGLSGFGDFALPLLCKIPGNHEESPESRIAAVKSMGRLGTEQALPRLKTLCRSKDHHERSAALIAISYSALSEPAKKIVLDAAVTALDDDTATVREAAMKTLADYPFELVNTAMFRALRDKDRYVRRAAASYLLEHPNARSTPLLVKALEDKDWQVRRDAALAIAAIGDTNALQALHSVSDDVNPKVRRAVLEAISVFGESSSVDLAARYIGDTDSDVRWASVEALASIETSDALDIIIHVLTNAEHWEVRKAAAAALGNLGRKDATEQLEAALKDEDRDVRSTAVASLGSLEALDALASITECAFDKESTVRAQAIETLGTLKCVKSLPVILKALEDPVLFVRRQAAQALCRFSRQDTLPLLAKAFRSENWDVKATVVKAIGKIPNEQALSVLSEMLSTHDSKTRLRIMDAIVEISRSTNDVSLRLKACKLLWWQLADEAPQAKHAFHCLEIAATGL